MASKKTEEGISRYLDSIGSKAKPIIDREAVKSLKAQVRSERNPIHKLKLLAALDEEQAGKTPDRSGDEAIFVAEAKAWADEEAIPVNAFQTMNVPDDVLTRAGFTVTTSRRQASSSRSSGSRAPRIPIEDVLAAARKLPKTWTLNDLASSVDREPATVRNYVKRMIEDGNATEIGDDPNHDGRGRAPKLYSTR